MHYENLFHLFLARLSENAGWVLQLVHDTRGLVVTDMQAELTHAEIDNVDACLKELEELGLVSPVDGQWKTTWKGAGVTNWRTHLHCAEPGQPVAEPREGENGHQPGPDCNEFRPALFAPGYCWCCRIRDDHAVKYHSSEAVKPAKRLLRR